MENDASGAGVLHGGLFSTAEIKILICYILSAVGEPVPVTELANLLHYEGIANGFEVSDAVVNLQKNGQIIAADSENATYVITDAGKKIADELKTSLSITVKERAFAATLKMMARYKNAKDTLFEITHENGRTYLSCSAIDGNMPFITVKMLLADEMQAGYIKEKFLEKPAAVFSKIIEMLTK